MQAISKLSVALILTLLSFLWSVAQAEEKHPMVMVAEHSKARFYETDLPQGFTTKMIRKPSRAKNFKNLVRYLNQLEAEKKELWKNYVTTNQDEFGDPTAEELAEIIAHPLERLEVKYLVEIEAVFKIFKNDRPIGYVFSTADHVQAAIYQDGAGIEIYTDLEFKTLATTDWSS